MINYFDRVKARIETGNISVRCSMSYNTEIEVWNKADDLAVEFEIVKISVSRPISQKKALISFEGAPIPLEQDEIEKLADLALDKYKAERAEIESTRAQEQAKKNAEILERL